MTSWANVFGRCGWLRAFQDLARPKRGPGLEHSNAPHCESPSLYALGHLADESSLSKVGSLSRRSQTRATHQVRVDPSTSVCVCPTIGRSADFSTILAWTLFCSRYEKWSQGTRIVSLTPPEADSKATTMSCKSPANATSANPDAKFRPYESWSIDSSTAPAIVAVSLGTRCENPLR